MGGYLRRRDMQISSLCLSLVVGEAVKDAYKAGINGLPENSK